MRTYKLTISYDGTRYQGWQRQQNTDRTIQGILERAISERAGYPVEINGSGRTDAGVHALGQTASAVLKGAVPEGYFTEDINRMLPPDIRICDAQLVKNGFHARKSALWKAYEYHIDTGQKPDVFRRRYCYHFAQKPDIDRMRQTAGYLTGTHDFAGYTDKKTAPAETEGGRKNNRAEKSTRRTIYDIIVSGQDGSVTIRYEGTGFLYHMVRILTGTLLEAGICRRTLESAADALITGDREQAGFLAPARGLFLREVHYDQWGR